MFVDKKSGNFKTNCQLVISNKCENSKKEFKYILKKFKNVLDKSLYPAI